MRGRKRQPEVIREAKAPVRSKRKAPVSKPQALSIGEVAAPAFRDPEAIRVWNILAPQLVALKLLQGPDVPAFSRYCRLAARFEQASKILDTEGLTYESVSAHGTLKRLNPAAMAEMRYSRELASLESSFGLTPSDRQRIFAERSRQGAAAPGDLFGDRGTAADKVGGPEAVDIEIPAAVAEMPTSGFLHS